MTRHRIRKLVGENTRFIYGIGGQLVAEFDGSTGNLKKEYVYGGATLVTIEPTAVNSNGTQYTTSDNLGSPRMITNSSAGIVSRRDYMPFGEELGAGVGGRTTAMGFSNSADNNRKKFTGYERDTETGLDFAQARYYSNTQGRFTSPDPFAGSATIGNPQTFNRYVYCGNNPVNATDPSGMTAQPGDRNIGNYSCGMAAESASEGLSQWADTGTEQSPSQQQSQHPAPPPSTQPPPVQVPDGQYFAEGSIDMEGSTRPLGVGEAPVPTDLVPIMGPNQTYNGNSVVSPTGTLLDGAANYGNGRVVDYLILDQGGNPMGPATGVTLTEIVSSPVPAIQAAISSGAISTSNHIPQHPENNGTVPDTQGAISRNPNSLNNNLSFPLVQTITVGMPNPANPDHPRNYIYQRNDIQVTPAGVTIAFGKPRYFTQN